MAGIEIFFTTGRIVCFRFQGSAGENRMPASPHEDEPFWIERSIIRITPDGRSERVDRLLREERYALHYNDERIETFSCLPRNLKELAVGFLFYRGLIRDADGLFAVDVSREARRIDVTAAPESPRDSGAEQTEILPEIRLTAHGVHALQAAFEERCELFRITGASHACALADEDTVLLFMEDVARHNSLDKILGAMLLQKISPAGKTLVFSGRLAADMLEKAARSGVKLLIAPGAPSLAAVDIAQKSGITLLGFVRPGNINIYTGAERIV